MKSCIVCANPCYDYYKFIAPKCNELLGQEASALRQVIASKCSNYQKAPQRFFEYSNGEPYDDRL